MCYLDNNLRVDLIPAGQKVSIPHSPKIVCPFRIRPLCLVTNLVSTSFMTLYPT